MTPTSRAAPFVAPFLAFLLCLALEGYFPAQHYVLYPVKTLIVAGVIAGYWRRLPSSRPRWVLGSAAVGIVSVVIWVGMDPYAIRFNAWLESIWHGITAGTATMPAVLSPSGRNPFRMYPSPEAWALFVCRVAGIAVCVPILEELFWRGFLMRWLIREDFESVPLGTYRPISFWITTAFFASVHGSEWLLAVIVGVIYGAWFVRTKTLGDIMVAHGVTNLLLALYCLHSGDWHFLAPVDAVTRAK